MIPDPSTRAGRRPPDFRPIAALVFAGYPLLALLSTKPDAIQVALVVALDVLFVGLMAAGRLPADHPGRTRWAIAAVLLLTAAAATLSVRDPKAGWIAMFYYASSSAVVVMPASTARILLLGAAVSGAASMYAATGDLASSIVQGISIAVIALVLLSRVELRRANHELIETREELATLAVQEERNRIARDLHDSLGHSLSTIALKSELARRVLPTDPDRSAAEIADVERVAREALASVREAVSGYRQPSLAIELAGARTVLAAAGIVGRVEPPPADLPPVVDTLLAWAVREGVTNVVRHSGAERAEIRVDRNGDEAAVEVVDDGTGLAAGSSGEDHGPAGSGLAGLRERAARMGGRVEAAPLPGRGFRLVVTVPVESS